MHRSTSIRIDGNSAEHSSAQVQRIDRVPAAEQQSGQAMNMDQLDLALLDEPSVPQTPRSRPPRSTSSTFPSCYELAER